MDFSILNTDSEWVSALQDLTNLVIKAIDKSNLADISNLRVVLKNYRDTLAENMHLSEFDNLESRALKVSNELNRASKTIALRNLNDLLSQLKELDKQLNVQTADATQTSNELQLKSTKEFLTKAKTSLTILKGLKAELDNDTTDLGKKVAAVFKAINDFEEAFPNT
jgi:hypothetical protein